MNDCVNSDIRDALPDLLHGRLSELDATTLSEHIASCAHCRAELAVLNEVRVTAPLAPALDVARIAAAVPAYAASTPLIAPARNRTGTRFNSWKLAAAAALIAIGGWGVVSLKSNAWTGYARLDIPATSVAGASSSESRSSDASAVEPSPDARRANTVGTVASAAPTEIASLSLAGGIQDLSDSDLEQLVSELDGIDAIPSSEPVPVTLTLDDLGAGQ